MSGAEAGAWQKKDTNADGTGASTTAPPRSPVFTQEACNAIVDRYMSFNCSATLDLDSLCALMTPDVVADYPRRTGIRGVDAYRAHVAVTFRAMSRFLRSSVVSRTGPVEFVGAVVRLPTPPGPDEVDIVVRVCA
jgi:hypothetical protein